MNETYTGGCVRKNFATEFRVNPLFLNHWFQGIAAHSTLPAVSGVDGTRVSGGKAAVNLTSQRVERALELRQ